MNPVKKHPSVLIRKHIKKTAPITSCDALPRDIHRCRQSASIAAATHAQCLERGRPCRIRIRHWDGFWFGKRKLWGDTFPHYWSTLTALVFARLAGVTGESAYAARARTCLRCNLSLFIPDGRASCAHVYPRTVNGQRAACNDPLANDQDWALIHWIWVEEILANEKTKN